MVQQLRTKVGLLVIGTLAELSGHCNKRDALSCGHVANAVITEIVMNANTRDGRQSSIPGIFTGGSVSSQPPKAASKPDINLSSPVLTDALCGQSQNCHAPAKVLLDSRAF